MLEVWTDGSSGKDGSGGWSCIVVRDDQALLSATDHAINTTNNRMELSAVINGVMMGLSYIKSDERLIVRSDSAYVVNCFKDRWYKNWLASNWNNSSGGQVKNRDLWETLLKVVLPNIRRIEWTHVKGHVGNKWNEQADKFAHEARMKAVAELKGGAK